VSYDRDTIQELWGLVTWRFFCAGLTAPSSCRFVLDESMHDSPRHFGGCTLDGEEVRISPSLARLPREVVLGVLAHEAGHCQDFCNPRRYGLSSGKLHWYLVGPKHKRTRHEGEVVADLLGGLAMGERIGYINLRGVGLIQCLGDGIARPAKLR
jgi:hypothetical protein